MRRGEVWWSEEPDVKPRPMLILARDQAVDSLSAVLVVPITATVRGISSELALGPEDGLIYECVATFDNLVSIPKVFLIRRMAVLSPVKLAQACQILAHATGCGF